MSLYLKYRPKDFNTLVGQEFIKKTLQTALKDDKMVSSYLLCWPRGTGKTTTARILAKWVNCQNLNAWNPCDTCETCEAFLKNSLIDIIEIDAASHTWVDNIREIIERAQFQPTTAKYKVYIIDEVHMLSKWAFNALLKILEEPPKHVKFILATTETHKVPETIISRCQRYDFKSITLEDIKRRLEDIADQEWITIDVESLDYIANAASGALRNAISLFEQLEENNTVEYKTIIERLWLTDNSIIAESYEKLLSTDLTVVSDVVKLTWEGKNIQLFYAQLLEYAKKQAIANLSSDDVQARIHILTKLNSWLTEMKHSFDPEVTTMTMLTQILGIYKEHIPQTVLKEVGTQTVVNSSQDIQTPIAQKETVIEREKQAEVVSSDDAHDIFWDISFESKVDEPQVVKEPVTNTPKTASSGFDKNRYIDALREIKTKWALIISLKQAKSFTLSEAHLEIALQNNFTLKAMNTGDNVLQLIKGLEEMWIEGKTVKLS